MIIKKKISIGIELLRIFFSFNIFFFHCKNKYIYKKQLYNINREFVSIGLITFFILAFYFSYGLFSSKNIKLIKQRFQRLLIPYIIWPIIIYIHKNNVFYYFLYLQYYKLKILLYQFLIGHGVAIVFWFSYNLIFISLMLTIIIFIIKIYLLFLVISSIPMYLYYTSNYYKNLFLNYNDIVAFSNRPLVSTYICGTIGFSLSYFKMIDKTNKKTILIICCSTLLMFLIFCYEKAKKFYFLKYLLSISLIILFGNLPFNKLKIENIVRQISSHTGGIYYIHININSLINEYIIFKYNIKKGTIIICIVNYIICYMLCFIGFRIFKKNKLKYLFI
jgi:hypothetical protein